jgi:hypothetical protein
MMEEEWKIMAKEYSSWATADICHTRGEPAIKQSTADQVLFIPVLSWNTPVP